MSLTSNVSYSGLNAQNAHRLKDIQRAEGAVSSYYNSQGGTTKRTSHWHIDGDGNVSHFAYVRREDKLNEKLRKEADENAKKLIEKIRENGYEFASLLAALISIAVTVLAAKKRFLVPKNTWNFGEPDTWDKEWLATSEVTEVAPSNMSLIKAWLPYLLVALILIITRIHQLGVKEFLTTNVPFVIKIDNLFGFENLDWNLKWAYLPGTFFIIVSIITNFIHKMDKEEVKKSWIDTIKQVGGASLALLFGLALVEILKYKNYFN